MSDIYLVEAIQARTTSAFEESLGEAVRHAQEDSLEVEIQYQASPSFYSALVIARKK